MSKYISQLEDLPNELILEVFKYFHFGELLESFYNLNDRFKNLIKSMNDLCLIISKENADQIEKFLFSSYLFKLINNDSIDFEFNPFNQIRYLRLIDPTDTLLTQISFCRFDNLQYLSIKSIDSTYNRADMYINSLPVIFPNIKSYSNIDHTRFQNIHGPTFHILKIGYMNLFTIQTILSKCPNLYYLDFGFNVSPVPSTSKMNPHLNLKKLIVRTAYNTWSSITNESIFEKLFVCTPNVKKLTIHRKDNISIIRTSFIKYNWLLTIIIAYYPSLDQLDFYFHILHVGKSKIVLGPQKRTILNQIIDHFQDVYNNRYQARLIID